MKNSIRIDYATNSIIVPKSFLKKAQCFGTPEYKALKAAMAENKGFVVVERTISKKAGKESYRNLTYKNMETYFNTQENSVVYFREYAIAKERSKIQASPYKYMLNWFVANFPNYKESDVFAESKREMLEVNENEYEEAIAA